MSALATQGGYGGVAQAQALTQLEGEPPNAGDDDGFLSMPLVLSLAQTLTPPHQWPEPQARTRPNHQKDTTTMTTTQNTADLISKARAAGLRLSCAGGKLRITAPPDVRAIFGPQLHEQSAAVLAWLRQEQTARILASSAARSDAATEKAVKLLKRKRKLDRGESLFPCDGHILAIDNSGAPLSRCLERNHRSLLISLESGTRWSGKQ